MTISEKKTFLRAWAMTPYGLIGNPPASICRASPERLRIAAFCCDPEQNSSFGGKRFCEYETLFPPLQKGPFPRGFLIGTFGKMPKKKCNNKRYVLRVVFCDTQHVITVCYLFVNPDHSGGFSNRALVSSGRQDSKQDEAIVLRLNFCGQPWSRDHGDSASVCLTQMRHCS